MKKILLPILLFLYVSTYGATGWFQDYIIIDAVGTKNETPYTLSEAYFWIGNNPNFGTEFNNYDFGTVTSVKISGADFKYWSDNQDRLGGSFWYKITLNDGTTDIVGFTEVIWTHNYLSGNDYQGTWTGSIDLLTLGLESNTSYKLHIFAKSWGSAQGDSFLSNDGANYVASFTTFNADTQWNGSENVSWNDANNWSDGVPNSGQSIWIPKNLTNYPIIDTDDDVTLNNVLISNNASLTIKSNATGTGSLITNGTVTGEVAVERHIPSPSGSGGSWDNNFGWRSISAPVTGQSISEFTVEPAANYDFYLWREAGDLWINYKAGDWNTYNTDNIGDLQSGNFARGRGYMVAYASQQSGFSFTGSLNNENVTWANLSLTGDGGSNYNNGWHLLGNPFASALTWNVGGWSLSNISTTAKIWSESARAFVDVTNDGVHQYIPAGQGFMVQALDATNSITIPTNARVHQPAVWYKNNITNGIYLIARESELSKGQESNIIFNDWASSEFDEVYDSRFLTGYAPKFYSVFGSEKLSTKRLPGLDEQTIIDFGFEKNDAESFAIELTNGIEGHIVYLTDKHLNKTQNLTEDPVYYFTSNEGDNPNRFQIHFGALSIDESSTQSAVNAYVHGHTLYVLNAKGQTQVELYDLQGRMLQSQRFVANGLHSQEMALPAGVYVVRVMDDAGLRTAKVVVR